MEVRRLSEADAAETVALRLQSLENNSLKRFLKLACNLLLVIMLAACSASNRTTEGTPTVLVFSPTSNPQPLNSVSNRTTEGAPKATVLPSTSNPQPPTPNLPPTQIAPGGCCQAFKFASDNRLYYYDNPAGANAATYVLDDNGQRQKLTNRFGSFSADLSLVAVSDRASAQTTIERVSDGTKLATLQNRASLVIISPNKTKLAYLLRSLKQGGAEAPQFFELWIGNIDGTQLRAIWTLREGANLAWFPDNRNLLLTARDAPNQRFGLWKIDTQAPSGLEAALIVESKGLRVASISANSGQVAYAVTLQGIAQSGIWLAQSDGSNRRKMDWTGAWQWSVTDGNELFYIPARSTGETGSALWSYNLTSGQATRLTDPATLPLQILTDEWEIAPDNKSIVYRNAADRTLWRLRFR